MTKEGKGVASTTSSQDLTR